MGFKWRKNKRKTFCWTIQNSYRYWPISPDVVVFILTEQQRLIMYSFTTLWLINSNAFIHSFIQLVRLQFCTDFFLLWHFMSKKLLIKKCEKKIVCYIRHQHQYSLLMYHQCIVECNKKNCRFFSFIPSGKNRPRLTEWVKANTINNFMSDLASS